MRFVFPIVAVLACTAAVANAAAGDILFAPPPSWAVVSQPLAVPDDARGLVFVRRQDYGAHLDKTGTTVFYSTLIRLIHPNALQLGNIAFTWNPAAGKPTIHTVKVHRNGAVRDVLATTKFEVLRRENQLEAAMLDGLLTATMRVPDLRVGDELELSYSIPAHDPTLGKDSVGWLFLNENPAPGRFALRLSWDEGEKPNFKSTPDFAAILIKGPRSITWTADQPGQQKPPKDAPPRYSWQRLIEFSDFASWQAVSSRFSPLFRKAAILAPQSTIKEEAAQIAAAHSDPRDRAAAALKLVQQQVRYVYVGFNSGAMTPATAEETWQRRYGDCKGKTVLLLALLGELGIAAEPVLVSNSGTDDGLDQRLPSPAFFDHVLVRAQIADQTLWLDGTMPPVVSPGIEPVMPYRWVLPINEAGMGIERVNWKPAARPDELILYEIDARAGFGEPAKRRTTHITRGPAAIASYYQLSAMTDEQLLSEFKGEMEGSADWITIDSVKWRFDSKNLASVIEIAGTGKIDWDNEGQNSRSLVLPGGGFYPPERRQRTNENEKSIPFLNSSSFSCHVTTVRLPSATAAKDWSFNTSFTENYFGQSYRRWFERRGNEIRMIRSKRTLQLELDPTSAAKDNDRVAKFDNSTAQIFYDPGSADVKKKAPQIVPATFEIDWVKDDSDCLVQKG